MSRPLATPYLSAVSVVIPTYNHANYLGQAIESVRAQTIPAFEIIVVDDGSTDDTRTLIGRYPDVRYIYQVNRGLSAARNTGLKASRGNHLVFLDADDRLLPEAIQAGLQCFAAHPDTGFVSGRYVRVNERGEILPRRYGDSPVSEHYLALLHGNYIGMHATVMYRREILEQIGGFDVSLRACEDYDVYLRIARDHPVATHEKVVAEYRMHDSNMSRDIRLMLSEVLRVLRRQKESVEYDPLRQQAIQQGFKVWRQYYAAELLERLRSSGAIGFNPSTFQAVRTLLRYAPRQLAGAGVRWGRRRLRSVLNAVLPAPIRGMVLERIDRRRGVPPVGCVTLGDLRRLTPISRRFGYDRGLPIDRYYIERFLEQHSNQVRGRVLEIGDNEYTRRFGGSRVTRSDILHVAEGNPQATFVGDLAAADHLPSDAFDCVVLTQTLHLIYDLRLAMRTLCRILKPGGVLLATVPGISQLEDGAWAESWHWSLTSLSARKLLEEVFPASAVKVEAHGNVLASIAFLEGLAAEELHAEELACRDPLYPLLITMAATKPST